MNVETTIWALRDEQFYSFLKMKYADRKKLGAEAEEKRKASEKMKDTDPHYHRMAIASDMAALRLDMAYIVDRNNQLEEMLGTVEYLHTKVGILEGAYGHLKLLFETCKMQTIIRNQTQEPATCPKPST